MSEENGENNGELEVDVGIHESDHHDSAKVYVDEPEVRADEEEPIVSAEVEPATEEHHHHHHHHHHQQQQEPVVEADVEVKVEEKKKEVVVEEKKKEVVVEEKKKEVVVEEKKKEIVVEEKKKDVEVEEVKKKEVIEVKVSPSLKTDKVVVEEKREEKTSSRPAGSSAEKYEADPPAKQAEGPCCTVL